MMREKNFHFSVLLDVYRPLLNEQRENMLDLYYNEDYSLSEISENTGLSRQGVQFLIKKGETQLTELESALGLAGLYAEAQGLTEQLEKALAEAKNETGDAKDEAIRRAAALAASLGALLNKE